MIRHEGGILPNVWCHKIVPLNVRKGEWGILPIGEFGKSRIAHYKPVGNGKPVLLEEKAIVEAVARHNAAEDFFDASPSTENALALSETNDDLPEPLKSFSHAWERWL